MHALLAQGATWFASNTFSGATTIQNLGNIWIGPRPSDPRYNNIPGLFNNTEVNGKIFFIGDVPANASDYYALKAPVTTIIDCPDAAAVTGASLFVEDKGDASSVSPNYYRLAYILGRNASGQTFHLKLHELILIELVPPCSYTGLDSYCDVWLGENSSRVLQQFKGKGIAATFTTLECYYQATSAGTVTLNFALIGKGYDGLQEKEALQDDSATFTIQVDGEGGDAPAVTN